MKKSIWIAAVIVLCLAEPLRLFCQTSQDTIATSEVYEGRADIVARACVILQSGFHACEGSMVHAFIDPNATTPSGGYHPSTGDLIAIGDSPTTGRNYIKTTTMRAATDDESLIEQTARTVMVEYLNGFGDLEMTVLVKGSPSRKDLVDNVVLFDIGNRVARRYLPHEVVDSDGRWRPNAMSEARQFYLSGTLEGRDADSRPWSEPEYDGSPLNRIVGEKGIGSHWLEHSSQVEYKCNAASKTLWKYDATNTLVNVSYPAGSLFYEKHIDEDGVASRVYSDNMDRKVLEETVGTDGGTLRTAYVYDCLGNLRCVVPPLASSPSDVGLCYYYSYDTHGRIVEKTVPDRGTERYVYDKKDRLVLSQDGNLLALGEWAFISYDVFGRQVLGGFLSSSLDRGSLQALFDAQTVTDEQWSANGTLYGYTGNSFPTSLTPSATQVKTVLWYDNYNFLGLVGQGYGCPQDPWGQNVVYDNRTKGEETGRLEKADLSGTTANMARVNYYDTEDRLLCSVTDNHLGGKTDRFFKYNFVGQVTDEATVHYTAQHDSVTLKSRHTYDHVGRELQEFFKLDANPEILTKAYEYNAVGDLLSVHLHSGDGGDHFSQVVRNRYNIRGWLTGINDFQTPGRDLFALKLAYESPVVSLSDEAHYNGSLSQMCTNGCFSTPCGYGFYYDQFNRLSESHYADGVGLQQHFDDFYEDYSYDANGNMLLLDRKHGGEYIDELRFSYVTGTNKINSVTDMVHSTAGYSYNSGIYDYDANGNPISDPSRHVDISYNRHNLPENVMTSQSDRVQYFYSASGAKLRKAFYTLAVPGGRVTDYCGEFLYEDNELICIFTPFGRIIPMETANGTQWRYCYSLADHLGNVRVEFAAHGGGQAELLQQTDYYPYGYILRRNEYGSGRPNRRLYGGKELQDETLAGITLNWYDFEARPYDPVIGRFFSTDPLAEKYYGLTPYGYCGNNPINAYDLHGDSISIVYNTSFLGLGKDKNVIYYDGLLFNQDGTAFNGRMCNFISQSVNALSAISQSDEGKSMLNELQSSNNMFSMIESKRNGFLEDLHNKAYANEILSNSDKAAQFISEGVDLSGGSGGKILWNPTGTLLHTTNGLTKNSYTDLTHELFHALDSNRGLLDDRKEQGLSRTEWQACYRENNLRIQLGYPVRTHYQTTTSLVKIVTENNSPIHPFWY